MKITIKGNIRVALKTLIRVDWKHGIPKLTIHERFETKVKWILRLLTIIGIITSIISINTWYLSLGLAVLLLVIEQFFERASFEYTTMVLMPLPDFEIDYTQWKTCGFMIPHTVGEDNLCYMGPSFLNRDYAIKFFSYLTKWNWDSSIDDENVIIVSIVLEPDSKYTMYMYSNPGRRSLDLIFKKDAKMNELSKYGKNQQKLFTQMIFWKTLAYNEDYLIHQFLTKQKPDGRFYFTPSVVPQSLNQEPEFLLDSAILKFGYKRKNREELNKKDVEYYFI